MNVSKRRRISLSLFGQDNGVFIQSHLATWKTKRKQNILHTKEKLQKLWKTKKKSQNYNLQKLLKITI